MGALIKGWRKEWGQGEFPFLYVQKPSGGGCAWDYTSPMMNQGDKFVPLPAAVKSTRPESGILLDCAIAMLSTEMSRASMLNE